jgi:hypothetical protein
MDPEDIDISTVEPPTDGLPDPAPEPMTDDFDLFHGEFTSYSQLMSKMTIDSGADISGTQYETPRASSYDTPGPSTRVPETQALADARLERPRRVIRPRDTYSLSLIRRMFRRR